MIRVHIDSIRRSIESNKSVVLLKEDGGSRVLPIWVDKVPGESLIQALYGASPLEPFQLPDDILKVLTGLGDLRIERLVITELQDNIFRAKVLIKRTNRMFGSSYEIECYPSAGLNLAVRTDSPIYVSDEVMEIEGEHYDERKEAGDPAIFYRDEGLCIRLADRNDAEIIYAMSMEVQQMYAEAQPDFYKTTENSSLEVSNIVDLLADTNNHFFIEYEDEKPVGLIHAQLVNQAESASYRARDFIYIYNIFVKESHRKKGHGKQLLETVRQLANTKDINIIELDVGSFNTGARIFFTKQGFIPMGERLCLQLKKDQENHSE